MENNQGKETLGKWISIIYRQFQMDINKVLKPFDLNSSQYIFLIELYKKDEVNQECLAVNLQIDKSAAARAIKQLETNGYVTRCKNPEDKRAYIVKLTDKALCIKDELNSLLKDWNDKLTRNLSEKDYEMVHDLLEQMARDILTCE